MSRFIETIRVVNGQVENLGFHQARFEQTRTALLGLKNHPKLEEEIQLPDSMKMGVIKCRVLYGHEIEKVEFQSYLKPDIRSLKVLRSDEINYTYKSADRSALTALFNQRDSCDDILIVKEGWITDSYFANVVLWDGYDWFTPAEPLLAGTMRASLLASGTIKERGIRIDNLTGYKSLCLINAMNGWTDRLEIPLGSVSR